MLRAVDLDRESDIEQLRRIAKTQQVQIDKLMKVLAAQSQRIDQLVGSKGELQQALALLEQLEPKSARRSDDADADAGDGSDRRKKKRKKFGSTSQPQLPVVEEVFELDEADITCPSCGGELRPMEGQFDVSEMIDVVEVEYRIVRAKQQKYSCGCGGCVETAPGPERATKGGRYSLAFAVKVVIDKYLDHLPLTRQVRIMRRHGLEVTSQTLWDQLHALAGRLRVVWEELFATVMRAPVIGLDQTSWKRLQRKNSKPWQMWCLTTPDLVYHRICDDKGGDTFDSIVGDYDGVIVCDKLSTHVSPARAGPAVQAGCWAHVFRRFRDASKDHPEARIAMNKIRQLYELDASAEGDLEALAEVRRTRSVGVLDELKVWLLAQAPPVPTRTLRA